MRGKAVAREPAICAGSLSTGCRQVGDYPRDLGEPGAVRVGFASGDDGDVEFRQRIGQRPAGHDIERLERDVRALEQEFQRRVGADIARRGERQEPRRLAAVTGER